MENKKIKKCFIIAEVSANHGQDYNRAVKMIEVAKECGADAVKFQAYAPDSLTIDCNNEYFQVKYNKWGGQTLYDLYKKAYIPLEWLPKLKEIADKEDIVFFATAFDKRTVDLLENINVTLHKISSFELIDLPLIEYAASKKKPLLLSTGMGTADEISEAIAASKSGGAEEVILLKCVSSYPAVSQDMNLNTIPDMRERFKCRVGLSDHSEGIATSLAAVALRAEVIEKHFTLSRKIKTPDNFFSMEPEEFKVLVENIRAAEKGLGGIFYGTSENEKKSRVFRRSLFAVRDIKNGETLTEDNIKSIRPGYGLPPKYLNEIIGKKAKVNIEKGTPLKWELVDL